MAAMGRCVLGAQRVGWRWMIPLLAAALFLAPGYSRSQSSLKSVEEEIEDLRGKLVQLNSDLDSLEQDLLVPNTAAVKVFLTSNAGKKFQLQALKVLLNDKMVGTHVYRPEENLALQNGGAQALFEGAIPPGDHTIIAQFTGVDLIQNKINQAIKIKFKGKEKSLTFIELRVGFSAEKKLPDFSYQIYE
ncbi:MAG: hypothetical protein AB1405_01110 [Bdellovibrionota bacterium]